MTEYEIYTLSPHEYITALTTLQRSARGLHAEYNTHAHLYTKWIRISCPI
jgi:hypothetical protein